MPPREGLEPVAVRERGFTPSELTMLFRFAGLSVTHVGGGTAGDWGIRPLELDEMEVMVLAGKVGEPVHLRGALGLATAPAELERATPGGSPGMIEP